MTQHAPGPAHDDGSSKDAVTNKVTSDDPGTDSVTGETTAPDLAEPEVDVPLLTQPSDGVPPVISDPAILADAIELLKTGSGPLAIDAERAHGFRYSQRAYLIQLRRKGSGTHLIDPVAFGQPADLSPLRDALADTEWIIHAASQDLPCLNEVRLLPQQLFDTELAARLLGYPRVALGTMIEQHFGVRLLKEHSAADWSTRPLPPEWLAYAALDVELLVELRDRLAAELVAAGKDGWAREEFAALVAGASIPAEPRKDPWRRTSGIHKVRSRRGLALVQELWFARDELAEEMDRAPGRLLPDLAITDLASSPHPDRAVMRQIPAFSRRQARRFEADWVEAIEYVEGLSEAELPPMHVPTDAPPQPRLWAAKDPAAAARLTAVRDALTAIATANNVPLENLLTPEYVRRLAWRPPTPLTEEAIEAVLIEAGARPWQRALTVAAITPLLAD